MSSTWDPASASYQAAFEAERRCYQNCTDIHQLPPIFHYWSNKHLRARLRQYGFDSAVDLFAQTIIALAQGDLRIISLGSGNCDFEIDIAARLKNAGRTRFTIDCVDLNQATLNRGQFAADAAGLADHFQFTICDLNSWQPSLKYHAAIANQSLHHVLNLEGLFAQVRASLMDEGVFLVSDMIGRNGHQRWPEALQAIENLWIQLPASYRVNRRFGYYQHRFEDWDCSGEGFEGVRAQDILPLLLANFSFSFFFPYGNLTDVFLDRAFGPNFDPEKEQDARFIDFVHRLDEAGFRSGQLTPTHLLAVLRTRPGVAAVYRDGLQPMACVRRPEGPSSRSTFTSPAPAMLADAGAELASFTERMAEGREVIRGRMAWALAKEAELEEATAWALRLDGEERVQEAERLRLESELAERTRWALQLHADLERSKGALAEFQTEFEARSKWALSLRDENMNAVAEIERLNSKLAELGATVDVQRHTIAELTRRQRFSRRIMRVLRA